MGKSHLKGTEASKQNYSPLWNVVRPGLHSHKRMPRTNRAAQFVPFSALNGLEEAFREAARNTDEEKELSEDVCAELNYILQELLEEDDSSQVKVTYFQPDASKSGGAYKEVGGKFLGVNRTARKLFISEVECIPLECVSNIEKISKI